MPKKEKPLVKFERCVSGILTKKIQEVEDLVSLIDSSDTEDDVASVLSEANSLISFACGKDDALYEEMRYRFLIDEKGRYFIFQGREVGVDPRDWSGKADPEE